MKTPPSLSNVLVVTVIVASVLTWGAVYGIGTASMYWPASGGFDRQLRIFSDGLAKVAAQDMEPAKLTQSLSGVNLVTAEFAGDAGQKDAAGFNMWDAQGRWVAGSPNVPRIRPAGPEFSGFYDAVLSGEAYRIYTRWTDNRKFRVDVMQSEHGRRADFNSVMLSPASVVAPLLVGLPLFLLPVLFVVHCGLKPMRKLSNELAARRPDDLTPVCTDELVAELQPVVNEINGTLHRLDDLLRREREFLADAAHELRTPLAVISAQADEVMSAKTPEARAEAERVLRTGLNRANRLVGQLLALARLEARADKGAPSDVSDVVRDVLASYAREAREKSIQLEYAGPDRLPMGCADLSLDTALGNLVANAVRYGRVGGRVVVRVVTEPSGAFVMSVCDDGPGIPPQDRMRMFERFRRGNPSGVSGSGLGLAIVASAVRLHDARLRVEDGIGGQGICVIVDVPDPGGDYPVQAGTGRDARTEETS